MTHDDSTQPEPKPLAQAALLDPAIAPKAGEVVWAAVPEGTSPTGAVASLAMVEPTQVRRPWRSTVRTAFQMLVALATLLPFIAADVYANEGDYPAVVVQVLVVASAVARVMANPEVEAFLRRFLPFLSAAPNEEAP